MKKKSIIGILISIVTVFQTNAQCVNFTQYQHPSWDNSIVISAITGTNTSESNFYFNQTLYIDFAVVNNGTCNSTLTVNAKIYLDNVLKSTVTLPILNAGFQVPYQDFLISGSLGVGAHTIKVEIDNPNLISETNELDNTFTRTFNVEAGSCVNSSVQTVFNGTKSFNTEHFLDTQFRLKDQCQPATIRVIDWNSTTSSSTNPLEIISGNNTWTTSTQRFGASVMWAAKKSYDYFKDVHSRNSYDGVNGPLVCYVNAVFGLPPFNTDNATMFNGVMQIGLGSSNTLADSWCPLDVIGHEYAHDVTRTSAGLVYANESGALNESFSDIFGEAIENQVTGTNDWLIGSQRTSQYIRHMGNPNLRSHPDTYGGTNWVNQSCTPSIANDQCGVHTNSGVQNYWFYLITQGGSGLNDYTNPFNITGLGMTKARAIAYLTLTKYLLGQPNANYAFVRNASISAAEELYGVGSTESNTVKNAWCAVGVGTSVPSAVTVPGGGSFCNAVILNATGGSGGTIYFQGTNSNGTSTANPTSSFTVNASGTYYFRAANGCGWGPSTGVTVTIVPDAGPVTVSGGGTFCNSATLTASGGVGGTIYWQGITAGGTSTTTQSTSQVVTSSGTYYFRVRHPSCGFGPQGSATVSIQTDAGPVTVSGGGTVCNSATLTATGGAGGTIYWQGTTVGGTSTSTPSTSQIVTASGTYYFRVRTTTCGFGPQGSATVVINPPPSAVTVSGGGTICGTSTVLNATGGGGGTIYWQSTNSTGTSFVTPTSSQTVTSSGTYYFRANNSCGWGPVGNATVTMNSPPTALSVTGGGNACNSATITASGGVGGTVYFQGTNPTGTTFGSTLLNQVVTGTGEYFFRAYNAGCGWGPAASTIVIVYTPPSVVNVSGGGTTCSASSNLLASGGSGGTIYWQGTNATGTSTATPSSNQTVTSSGTYYFRANNAGCGWGTPSSASVTIIPNTLTLNASAPNGLQKAKTSIVSNQSIVSGRNVIYEAGNAIELTGVFLAEKGSVFKAEIKTCN